MEELVEEEETSALSHVARRQPSSDEHRYINRKSGEDCRR